MSKGYYSEKYFIIRLEESTERKREREGRTSEMRRKKKTERRRKLRLLERESMRDF